MTNIKKTIYLPVALSNCEMASNFEGIMLRDFQSIVLKRIYG
jgi:hypothetical protein